MIHNYFSTYIIQGRVRFSQCWLVFLVMIIQIAWELLEENLQCRNKY